MCLSLLLNRDKAQAYPSQHLQHTVVISVQSVNLTNIQGAACAGYSGTQRNTIIGSTVTFSFLLCEDWRTFQLHPWIRLPQVTSSPPTLWLFFLENSLPYFPVFPFLFFSLTQFLTCGYCSSSLLPTPLLEERVSPLFGPGSFADWTDLTLTCGEAQKRKVRMEIRSSAQRERSTSWFQHLLV